MERSPRRITFEPRSRYEIYLLPFWISYVFDTFTYLFVRCFCFTLSMAIKGLMKGIEDQLFGGAHFEFFVKGCTNK